MAQEEEELQKRLVLQGEQAFALDWHPSRELLAVGLITGQLQLYLCDEEAGAPSKEASAKPHKGSCRAARFSADGVTLFSCGADRLLQQRDVATNKPIWRQLRAHDSAINALTMLESTGVATGDDDGELKLWDVRQRSVALSFSEHTELITDMIFCDHKGHHLAVSSGDSCLSVFDLRKGRLFARSDTQEDELLSLALVKSGKKLLCGLQNGVLGIFSWGDFGDVSDRFTGLGSDEPVEAIVALSDDIVRPLQSAPLLRSAIA